MGVSAVTERSEPPEDETESACESPEPADDQGEASSSARKGSTTRGMARGPFNFRLMPETQLNSLLSLADLANRIVPEPPAISTFVSGLSSLMPASARLPWPRIEELVLPALRLPDSVSRTDYASFFPKIEVAFPKVGLPDLSSFPQLSQFALSPAFVRMLERLRESLPPNWPDDIDLDKVTTIVQDEGLPLVWVPRAEIVTELLAAPDRTARVEVLLTHLDEVVDACRVVLGDVSHTSLSGQQPLVSDLAI
jgi:hypothetical protein